MKKFIQMNLVGVAIVASAMGCANEGSSTAAPKGDIDFQALSTGGRDVVWNTEAAVPKGRQIEVGNHPSLKLDAYTMGNRPQKVRFFVTDQVAANDLLLGSPQDTQFRGDLTVNKALKYSIFAMVIDSPSQLGHKKFSESSNLNGLAVNPQLMVCAAQALATLKQASDGRTRAFQNWQLNTTNIYVRPVEHAFQAQSRMAIDIKQRSLNFQVSLWTRSGDCFLPTKEEMEQALDIADQRVED